VEGASSSVSEVGSERDVINRIVKIVEELKHAMVGGFGFSSAKALLKRAREHLQRDEFEKALELLEEARGEVEREKRIAAELDRLCNNAPPSLKKMCDRIVESTKRGDLDTAEEVLNRLKSTEAIKVEAAQTVSQPRVGEGGVVGDFCLEYQGGVIPLAGYTVVGRGDFSGLPERALAVIDERHFAVYYKDGVWWVEDLGSRYGTYLNGVKVKRERLREGDVISPGAAVAVMFKRCGTTRRVVPMEEEEVTKTY